MYSMENMNKIWFVTRLKLFVFILSSKPSRMYRHFYGCLNSLISAKGFNWIKYLRNAFLLHFQLKPPRMRNLGTAKSPSTIQNFPKRKVTILYVPYLFLLLKKREREQTNNSSLYKCRTIQRNRY